MLIHPNSSFYGMPPAMGYGMSFYGGIPLMPQPGPSKLSSNKSFKSQQTGKSRATTTAKKPATTAKPMYADAAGDSGGFKVELMPTTMRLTKTKTSSNGKSMRLAASSKAR
jgi:hypothetical protein